MVLTPVRVTLGLRYRAVTQERLHLIELGPSLDGPAGARVSQVVPSEPLDACAIASLLQQAAVILPHRQAIGALRLVALKAQYNMFD